MSERRDHLRDHRPTDLRRLRDASRARERTGAARRLTSVACAAVFVAAVHGCARERVEIAETEGTPAGATQPPRDAASERAAITAPLFPFDDAGTTTCGPPSIVALCDECPNGFVWVDGEATCECCP